MAPLTDNPNAPNRYGETPIWLAACRGYIDIVKFLAPLTDNPIAQEFKDGDGSSSIAMNTEIRRFLESFKKPSKNF